LHVYRRAVHEELCIVRGAIGRAAWPVVFPEVRVRIIIRVGVTLTKFG
jgi:hypothetical protein